MNAITVKWLKPTNRRGARIKASYPWGVEKKYATVDRDYNLTDELNELRAVRKLLEKLNLDKHSPNKKKRIFVRSHTEETGTVSIWINRDTKSYEI